MREQGRREGDRVWWMLWRCHSTLMTYWSWRNLIVDPFNVVWSCLLHKGSYSLFFVIAPFAIQPAAPLLPPQCMQYALSWLKSRCPLNYAVLCWTCCVVRWPSRSLAGFNPFLLLLLLFVCSTPLLHQFLFFSRFIKLTVKESQRF